MISVMLMKLFTSNFINTYSFYSNKNFTDNGLTNFGKSFETLPALNSISLDFY